MFVGWPAGRRLGEIMGPWLEAVGSTLLLIFSLYEYMLPPICHARRVESIAILE